MNTKFNQNVRDSVSSGSRTFLRFKTIILFFAFVFGFLFWYANQLILAIIPDNGQKQYFFEVKNGDMTLTSDFLDGKYNEQNQIEELIARKKVSITKGEGIKAQCERAAYNAREQTLTLTENPQLEQNGSTLSADLIRIYLQDNRSVAEGQVRVKVTNASTDVNQVK